MATQTPQNNEPIRQPLTPEEVPPEQTAAHREAIAEGNPTINPGDVEHQKSHCKRSLSRSRSTPQTLPGTILWCPPTLSLMIRKKVKKPCTTFMTPKKFRM